MKEPSPHSGQTGEVGGDHSDGATALDTQLCVHTMLRMPAWGPSRLTISPALCAPEMPSLQQHSNALRRRRTAPCD